MSGQIVKHGINSDGKDFIVGDIHGCLSDFSAMLKAIGFNKKTDRMFSVGDLIDRGPDSVSCLSLMFDDWFYPIIGNHEQMMIDAVLSPSDLDMCNMADRKLALWESNGGEWNRDADMSLLTAMATELTTLPYIRIIGDGDLRINLVHAELVGISDSNVDEWCESSIPSYQLNSMIWGRTIATNLRYANAAEGAPFHSPNLSLTIVGHTPLDNPIFYAPDNHLFIDTGCVYRHIQTHTLQDRFITCVDITDKYNINVLSYSPLYDVLHIKKLSEITIG